MLDAKQRVSRSRWHARSKEIFDSELQDAAIVRARDDAERRRSDRPSRLAVANPIEGVERLEPQLDLLRSSQLKALEQRDVRTVEARTADRISRLVSNLTGVRGQRQSLKADGVEPLRDRVCRIRVWIA